MLTLPFCEKCKEEDNLETAEMPETMPKEIKNEYKTTKKRLIKAYKRIQKAQSQRIQELEATLNIDHNGDQIIDQIIDAIYAYAETPKEPEAEKTPKLKFVDGKIYYGDKEIHFGLVHRDINGFKSLKKDCINNEFRFSLDGKSYRMTPDMFEDETPKEPEFSTDAMMENKEVEKKKEKLKFSSKGYHDVDEFYRDDEHRVFRTDKEVKHLETPKKEARRRIELALDMACDGQANYSYSREEAIDRIIRALTGCETVDEIKSDYRGSWTEKEFLDSDEYNQFVAEYEDGGKFTYPYKP
jgi:hypothetical protein